MTVGTLPSGSQGGDSNSICDLPTAFALSKAGVRFLCRYISRTSPQHTNDLSAMERNQMLHAGLAVGYVQHYPGNGWVPSQARGAAYGAAMVANMRAIGASTGVCAWRDFEGLLSSSSSADCISDINSWNAAVLAGGYVPGIYVGYDSILSASYLYWRLTCRHYWKSASKVPTPVIRGYQVIQTLAPSPIAGYDWDRDVVIIDGLDGLPIFDLP